MRSNDWPRTDAVRPDDIDDLGQGHVFAGRYRIEAELGRGGFGTVHRAVELGIERPVALKILNPERDEASERLRFRREADLARRLSHPNTVRLLDFGEDPQGKLYIAYELLEGNTLGQAMKAGALDTARAARITAQLLKSLMEAHALGLVHRDIKPANVMLCDFAGERDFVKLLDFGIARDVESAVTRLTDTGTVLGTPRYMAPEQIRGDAPSASMDLFAVGVTLAEMLGGRPLYRGAPMDVCLQVLSDDPVPLSAQVLSSPLAPVVSRALDKDPRRRYTNAEQMLRELESVRHAPSTSEVAGPSVSAAPAPEKPLWPKVGIALGLLTLLAGVGVVALGGAFALWEASDLIAIGESATDWKSEALVRRLGEHGWASPSVERSDKLLTIRARKGSQQVTVLRMTGKSDSSAEIVQRAYEKQGYAIARDRVQLLCVRVQPTGTDPDAAASRTLRDQLK